MATTNDQNLLVSAYRKYIGPGTPEQAIGYWLFLIGAIAGVTGVLVFMYSTVAGTPADPAHSLREISIVLASIGLTLLLLGVVFRLPVRKQVRYIAIIGAVITFLATLWFIWAYPGDWAVGADYSTWIIGLYSIGLGLVVVASLILPAVTETPESVYEDLAEAAAPASKAQFELFRDRADDWRWRLRHDNGNIIASSGEAFSSKQKARQGLSSVQRNAGLADVTVMERPEDASNAKFEIYQDRADEWRWGLRHDNGNLLADSGEGYSSKSSVTEAIDRVKSYAETADSLRLAEGAFDLYEDRSGEYRWRLLASNGRIIADSGEGYSSRSGARAAIERVRAAEEERVEIFEDQSGESRWRFVSKNGEIMADSGEGYSSKSNAKQAKKRFLEYAKNADLLSIEEGAFDLYKDKEGQWRWRLLARNGEIIADCGEAYSSRSKAQQGLESVRKNAPVAPVKERERSESVTGSE